MVGLIWEDGGDAIDHAADALGSIGSYAVHVLITAFAETLHGLEDSERLLTLELGAPRCLTAGAMTPAGPRLFTADALERVEGGVRLRIPPLAATGGERSQRSPVTFMLRRRGTAGYAVRIDGPEPRDTWVLG